MKLNPRLKPYYNYKELLTALIPSKGNIPKYEQAFARKFGCEYGVMFSYGRAALYSLFKVLGLKNAEVICPAYTCVVVSHAIVLSGNIPVFVDCAKNSFNMDYGGIEEAITAKTKAIIATHLFGHPMDVHKIRHIAEGTERKYGHKVYVIQDTAHSFGAYWQNEMVTKFGDASIFSLNISKTINSIFGGIVTTNNGELYERLIEYRKNNFGKPSLSKNFRRFLYLVATYIAFNEYVYNFVNLLERKGVLDNFVKYYNQSTIEFPKDWNDYPCEIEARVGLVQLEKYDDIVHKRIMKSKEYIERFRKQKDIEIFPFMNGSTYSHCVALVKDRKEWLERYYKNGLQLGILIEYSIPYMRAYAAYKKKEYPVSKYYSECTINFPNWAGIKSV